MKKLTLSALVVIASSAAASTALAQDVAAGKTSFNKCMACHSIGEGAKNKVGPELNGLDGRKSGTVEGYTYSDANKNSGITWNEALFKEYIKDPKAKVPGTKMAFAGIKNENEINDLWAYRLAIRQGRQDQGPVARSRVTGNHRFDGARNEAPSASPTVMPKALRHRGHFNILRCPAGDARLRGTPIAGNRRFMLEQMRSPRISARPSACTTSSRWSWCRGRI